MPFSSAPASVGNHSVEAYLGNGHGSVNTKIRRFSATNINVGTAISYVDSATDGASFTINEQGLYEIFYLDCEVSFAGIAGVSKNSASLTTAITQIGIGSRVLFGAAALQGGAMVPMSRTMRLNVGDVIRPHTDGTPNVVNDPYTVFSITKVAV